MSRAFVIKVKENCYWLGGFYGKNNYGDLAHAKTYVSRKQAVSNCADVINLYGYDAKVVEVEIREVEERDCPCFCVAQEDFHIDQAIGYLMEQAEKEVKGNDN